MADGQLGSIFNAEEACDNLDAELKDIKDAIEQSKNKLDKNRDKFGGRAFKIDGNAPLEGKIDSIISKLTSAELNINNSVLQIKHGFWEKRTIELAKFIKDCEEKEDDLTQKINAQKSIIKSIDNELADKFNSGNIGSGRMVGLEPLTNRRAAIEGKIKRYEEDLELVKELHELAEKAFDESDEKMKSFSL